jgi:hypothetical protein
VIEPTPCIVRLAGDELRGALIAIDGDDCLVVLANGSIGRFERQAVQLLPEAGSAIATALASSSLAPSGRAVAARSDTTRGS